MLERNEPLTKKDMLEFIRAHREALNEKTVKASPQEEGQFLPEMQMWNAIEAQVREMSAVEYLREKTEMCDFFIRNGFGSCDGCPRDKAEPRCGHLEEIDPRRAVEVVKKWKEEQA